GGVLQLDRSGNILRFGPQQGISSLGVRNLMMDREGKLWVASRDGLYRSKSPVSPGRTEFERVLPETAGQSEGFLKLTQDRDGAIWAAGECGLARFASGRWSRMAARDGLKSDQLLQVSAAPDGSIWISYRESLGVSHIVP